MKLAANLMTLSLMVLFCALALRALVLPQAAAEGFGLPPEAFVRVYGARTLVLAAATGVLLALREARALAVLLTCAAALPVFDMALLARPSPRHLGALVLLLAAAGLWWAASRRPRPA